MRAIAWSLVVMVCGCGWAVGCDVKQRAPSGNDGGVISKHPPGADAAPGTEPSAPNPDRSTPAEGSQPPGPERPHPPERAFCGNGVCEASNNETPNTCPKDCAGPRCGDGTCDSNEDVQSCPLDCKADPCGDGTCDSNAGETAQSCPKDCKPTGPQCGDGKCEGSETAQSCPKDCKPTSRCGDGNCDSNEDVQSCPLDCKPAPRCGDGNCDSNEDPQSCPQDCKPASTIWSPKPGTTWQWQLSGKLDLNKKVQMYDIDLFDHPASTIGKLKAKGIAVICYFSAGSYEKWRPDAKQIPTSARGQKMDGWDELWLDIRNKSVWSVMQKRLDLAKQKGCDGVEPDNVDGYQNKTGFPLKSTDQLAFNKMLAQEAHKRGLSIGLKNDLDQVKALVGYFDFAVNEECVKYNECKALLPFIQAGKAVFHVEYPPQTRSKVCPKVKSYQFSTLLKKLNLDAWMETCP